MTAVTGRGEVVLVMAMGFAARFPFVMISLVLVLLLRDAGYAYSTVGVVAAAYIVATGILSPAMGRLVDRITATPVLLGTAALCSGALGAMAAFPRDLGAGGAVAVAAMAGATAPPVTAVFRATVPRLVDEAGRQTVYAMEAALQEALFVVGPLAVVLAVGVMSPAAALGICAALVLGLVVAFALVVRGRAAPRGAGGSGWAMSSPALRQLVAVYGLLGITFGSAELAVVAAMDAQGRRGLAGVVLAFWALGSLIGGLVVARRSRGEPHLRLPGLLIALSLLTLPLVLVQSQPVLLGAALLAQGAVVAPSLGTIYELIPRLTPDGMLTEAFAWGSSFIYAGIGLGNALAGAAVGRWGPPEAFAIAAVAPLLALLLARPLARRTLSA